ncbi:MAG: acyl--CoA ligase [Solobacterium sp.]|nr:acyl--CoA ligase [Solobacterium sp.]
MHEYVIIKSEELKVTVRYRDFEDLLIRQAQDHADGTAFLKDGLGRITYGRFYQDVLACRDSYAKQSFTCLGLLADGSYECILTLFGSVLAGKQVVMLDRQMRAEQLIPLIGYTDIDQLWGDDAVVSACRDALTDGVRDGAGKILFFTSGTTERAKAVVLTDASLMQSAYNGSCMLELKQDDILLNVLPLSHVFGFVCGLLWGLSCGACVALGRGPRHYIDDCRYFRPTAVSLVPSLLGFLLQHDLLNEELDLILVGAGPCSDQLISAVREKGIRLACGYGLTETSSGVAISTSGDPFAMAVCPDDTMTLAEDGEILVSAPTCMMQGYYKREADTDAVLKDGVLYTGDLGRFDETGLLHITGRKKEILVLPDGTKIFLPEYEAMIRNTLHTDDVCMVLRNGRPVLVLGKTDMSREAVSEALREVMKQVPRGQRFTDVVILGHELPTTATGKIRRWEAEREINA